MNDDELIDRLRRALQTEADDLTPGYGTPRVTPVSVRPRHRRGLATRGYVAIAAAAVIAAAVTIVVGAVHSPNRLNVVATAPTSPNARTHKASNQVTTPPAAGAKAPAPGIKARQVPTVAAAFVPLSVTFVSANIGWVLGVEACGTSSCLRLDHTTTRGASWQQSAGPSVSGLPLPTAADNGRRPQLQVRFADSIDGWIYGTVNGSTPALWSTHDGGANWSTVPLANTLATSRIEALETAGDRVVQLLVLTDAGTAAIATSSVHQDDWTMSKVDVPVGTDGSGSLVVQGSNAWVLAAGKSVVGGATLDASGAWTSWSSAPCVGDVAPPLLAASDANNVVAVCTTGTKAQVAASRDGGQSFTLGASFDVPGGVAAVASANPTTLLVAGAQPGTLYSSTNAGATWTLADEVSNATVTQIGFENSQQGVAVLATSTGGELLMTSDGGQSFTPVELQS